MIDYFCSGSREAEAAIQRAFKDAIIDYFCSGSRQAEVPVLLDYFCLGSREVEAAIQRAEGFHDRLLLSRLKRS